MAARLAFLLVLLAGTDALRCDWGYEGHTSGPSPFDRRFALNISVDATGYRPNAEYDGEFYIHFLKYNTKFRVLFSLRVRIVSLLSGFRVKSVLNGIISMLVCYYV